MSQHIRILQGFKSLTDSQLVALAGAVLKGFTGSAIFPVPPVDLKAFETAMDEVIAAIAAQAQGGTAATAHKINKRDELIALLRRLANYVQDNSGGNAAIVLDSGFVAATPKRTRTPLEKPTITAVDFAHTTQLVVKVNPVARARCYEVRYAALGSDGAAGQWQNVGIFTNSRSMKVTGLTPGTTYAFQVRAIGGSTGYSDWCDSIAHICV